MGYWWFTVTISQGFRSQDTQRTPSKKLDPFWRSWGGDPEATGGTWWFFGFNDSKWFRNDSKCSFERVLIIPSLFLVSNGFQFVSKWFNITGATCKPSGHDLPVVEQSAGRVLLEKISQHEQIEVFKAFLRTTASCSLHFMFQVSFQVYNGIARDQIYHVADETWQCTKKWGVSAVSNGKIQQAWCLLPGARVWETFRNSRWRRDFQIVKLSI